MVVAGAAAPCGGVVDLVSVGYHVLVLNDIEPAPVFASHLSFSSDQGKTAPLVQSDGRLVFADDTSNE